MALVYAFMADGFEIVECLAVVDILRRGRVEVETVSITGNRTVTCSHNIPVVCDRLLEEIDIDSAKCLFLPGGKVGTMALAACRPLVEALKKAAKDPERHVAAICAAPSVLGQNGILVGKSCTCYPGFEDKLIEAEYTGEAVVTDGNVTTGKGMGVSIEMGLELLRVLKGPEKALEIKKQIQL